MLMLVAQGFVKLAAREAIILYQPFTEEKLFFLTVAI
jgi:hypothetical protein